MEIERVQASAFGQLKELPEQFIRPAHERPESTNTVQGVGVPVISLCQPHDVLVKEVDEACRDRGFFLLTVHGISPSLIQQLQEVVQEFFGLTQGKKEAYANNVASGKFEGEVTEEYNKEMLRLADKLLQLLSEGLALKGKDLKYSLGDGDIELKMKINFYPPCPQPEMALGVEPHTDISALTLLVSNDVPGLEVSKDGDWVAVNDLPDALFVHVVLSNGKYKSVLHRSLVNKERTLMSWAVFVAPPQETTIGPVPALADDQNPAKYSIKTYGEFGTVN